MRIGERVRRKGLLKLTLALVAGLLLPTIAFAGNTIHVSNNQDAGAGSLRAAIGAANSGDTITFDNTYTVTLTQTLPALTVPVTLQGDNSVIEGSGLSGAAANGLTLNPSSGTSTISNIAIQDFPGAGGGILVQSGTVSVVHSTLQGNAANGIDVTGGTATIGGSSAGQGDNIFGNGNGIAVDANGQAFISGNFIGADASHTPHPNGGGILLRNGANTSVIGGSTPNVISGNSTGGIIFDGSGAGNAVVNNDIGTFDSSFANLLANNGPAIVFKNGSVNNQVYNNFLFTGTNTPIVLNGFANDIDPNTFLMSNLLPFFDSGSPETATFGAGAPTFNGSNTTVPFTVGNAPASSSFVTFLNVLNTQPGGLVLSQPQNGGSSTVMAGSSGTGSGTFSFPGMVTSGALGVTGYGARGSGAFANPFYVRPSSSTPPGSNPVVIPPPTLLDPFGLERGRPLVAIDPRSGAAYVSYDNGNSFAVDDTFSLAIGDFNGDGGIRAHVAAKKNKKKPVHEFKLAPVTVMVAPGKKGIVKIPLTATAKRFAKTHKTVSWAIAVKESDAAGHSKTFAAHGKVKPKSSKPKKHKKH